VIRKSVEGLQVVGAVHHKPKLDGAIVLLLARDGGLQSEELYVGEPKPDDMGCPGPAVDAG
jgi:hypothetical protein